MSNDKLIVSNLHESREILTFNTTNQILSFVGWSSRYRINYFLCDKTVEECHSYMYDTRTGMTTSLFTGNYELLTGFSPDFYGDAFAWKENNPELYFVKNNKSYRMQEGKISVLKEWEVTGPEGLPGPFCESISLSSDGAYVAMCNSVTTPNTIRGRVFVFNTSGDNLEISIPDQEYDLSSGGIILTQHKLFTYDLLTKAVIDFDIATGESSSYELGLYSQIGVFSLNLEGDNLCGYTDYESRNNRTSIVCFDLKQRQFIETKNAANVFSYSRSINLRNPDQINTYAFKVE